MPTRIRRVAPSHLANSRAPPRPTQFPRQQGHQGFGRDRVVALHRLQPKGQHEQGAELTQRDGGGNDVSVPVPADPEQGEVHHHRPSGPTSPDLPSDECRQHKQTQRERNWNRGQTPGDVPWAENDVVERQPPAEGLPLDEPVNDQGESDEESTNPTGSTPRASGFIRTGHGLEHQEHADDAHRNVDVNAQRHEKSWAIQPPIRGPNAAIPPNTAPHRPKAAARRSPRKWTFEGPPQCPR